MTDKGVESVTWNKWHLILSSSRKLTLKTTDCIWWQVHAAGGNGWGKGSSWISWGSSSSSKSIMLSWWPSSTAAVTWEAQKSQLQWKKTKERVKTPFSKKHGAWNKKWKTYLSLKWKLIRFSALRLSILETDLISLCLFASRDKIMWLSNPVQGKRTFFCTYMYM